MKAPQLDMQYEQLGSVYTGWRNVCLEDTQMMIIDGDRGKNYPKQEEFKENGYCLFLSASNVTKTGFKFNSCLFISQEREQLLGKGRLQRNDLVLTTRGTVGNAAYYDSLVPYENIRINSGMVIIRNRDSQIDTRFVYLLLSSDVIQDQIKRIAFGSAQPQLTVATIKKLKIPLPPLPEQRKIAEILSTWDEAIDLTEQLIAAKQRRKQALMQRLLTGQVRFPEFAPPEANLGSNLLPHGWKTDLLGNIVMFLDERRKPVKQNDREKIRGTIPYYGASGIIDYVDDYIFDDELILLGEDGANILTRSTRLVFRVSGKCWINNHAHVIKPKSSMDIDYLCEYLESLSYVQYNTGTAQPKLTKETCQSIPVVIPPLEEQIRISSVLRLCDEELDLHQQKLAALRRQKQGLMQQLLTGRLRVVI